LNVELKDLVAACSAQIKSKRKAMISFSLKLKRARALHHVTGTYLDHA